MPLKFIPGARTVAIKPIDPDRHRLKFASMVEMHYFVCGENRWERLQMTEKISLLINQLKKSIESVHRERAGGVTVTAKWGPGSPQRPDGARLAAAP